MMIYATYGSRAEAPRQKFEKLRSVPESVGAVIGRYKKVDSWTVKIYYEVLGGPMSIVYRLMYASVSASMSTCQFCGM